LKGHTTTGDANGFVCVGGSVGGLDAYIRLFRHLPNDMGVAVVIVNHLRTVAALLPEILLRYTGMPVSLIAEGLPVTPNRVFMIPEKRDLHVCDGAFQLKPMSKHRGWPAAITVCLVSPTRHRRHLIAVIVFGYDGDGTEGFVRHKGRGRNNDCPGTGILDTDAPGVLPLLPDGHWEHYHIADERTFKFAEEAKKAIAQHDYYLLGAGETPSDAFVMSCT
jgi:hypothetical protein